MRKVIDIIIYSPLYFYLLILNKNRLFKEINRWREILPIPKSNSVFFDGIWLIKSLREFRTLLYFRYKIRRTNPILRLYPPQTALYIPSSQNIGDGLVIQHGFSTIFNCEKMGKNCQVWQGVTIGKAHSGKISPRPIIGDNVKICTNSVVIGGITIGNNVTIGAGAIVTKSIPDNCVVAGNPAKIIKTGRPE